MGEGEERSDGGEETSAAGAGQGVGGVKEFCFHIYTCSYRSHSNYPNGQTNSFHHHSMLNRKQNNCPHVMFQCIRAVFQVAVLSFSTYL